MIRENFNKDWQMATGGNSAATAAFMGTDNIQTVHLPHDAMIHETPSPDTESGAQTGFYPGGEYIYQKNLYAPEEWRDQTVLLEFEGVYQTAMVYINGALAARNLYGYSGFYVELNPWLNYGASNRIKVIANNSMTPNSRWYTGSGIYRNVNLMTGGRIHVPADGVRITTLSADPSHAVVEISVQLRSISRMRETVQVTVSLEKDGQCAASDCQTVVMYPNARELYRQTVCVEAPKLWDCDTPELYQCRVQIESAGEILDKTQENFGIRTLLLDASHGLRLNGKTVRLRGTCIHHDNGILGAATFPCAEDRRCKKLKEAGFNSIRSAHHPVSRAMLDACDRYGMLVMDELSDMWTYHKNPYDLALYFDDCWEQAAEQMVAKDYNHPSVILYSAGNEIPEAGSEAGAAICRKICNKLHSLDHTRYTTMGQNGLMTAGIRLKPIMQDIIQKFGSLQPQDTSSQPGQGSQDGSNGFNSFMSLMEGERGEYFSTHPLLTEALEGCSSSCDIIGLNYLTGRHVLEHQLHPNKTVIGTETYPADIARLWGIVKRHPHMLGDFTWTGWDYLGEAGCGIFHYDNAANFTSIYPERAAYIGDLDLTGYRRPISYLREIVYGIRKAPYLAVERLDKYGMTCSRTPWMHKDNLACWTWPGYEGRPAVVDVYADADETELFLNGVSLGRKPAGEANAFTAVYELAYEPGELTAVSYTDGIETGRASLVTAGNEIRLCAEADRTVLNADGEDLAFITIRLTDENGIENLTASKKVSAAVEGAGRLEAFGSAEPKTARSYGETEWDTYDGYALAVVRAGETEGNIRVRISADGCEEQVVEIDVAAL